MKGTCNKHAVPFEVLRSSSLEKHWHHYKPSRGSEAFRNKQGY